MKTNWKGGNNTNENRDDFFRKMRETSEYKREFNPRIGELTIWFVTTLDEESCKVSMYNTFGSCTIHIEHFRLNQKFKSEIHRFHTTGFEFAALVNAYLLKEEDLEQQRVFKEQDELRKQALKDAHNSKPQRCAGVFLCEYCDLEARRRQATCNYGT